MFNFFTRLRSVEDRLLIVENNLTTLEEKIEKDIQRLIDMVEDMKKDSTVIMEKIQRNLDHVINKLLDN